jgi:2-keto-4-pentenoate hydratase/2-oxohepta-3-ene-1,7-dioic acid hydratase in catechol pathway
MKFVSLDQSQIAPSKIVCIGRNYVAHIEELGNEVPAEPVIFLKPNSAIAEDIYTDKTDAVHYEGEITFVVKEGRLAAVGFGLDLTKREIQSRLKEKGLPWDRAKSFDRSAVFSNFISFSGEIESLRMELHINGALIQAGGYEMMINKPEEILRECASFITLNDNDLLMTGTPQGVGPLVVGDEFTGKIFQRENAIVEASWVVK